MGPGGYGINASDLLQQSGMAQMKLLHGMIGQLNNTRSTIYLILESREDYMKWLTENGDRLRSDEH